MGKQVIILHGWRNHRFEGHWQRLTAAALRKQGHQVFYPQLPSPDEPRYEDWAEVILTELALAREANQGEEIVILGHSLGCVTWLKLVEEGLTGGPVGRVLLVAPADPKLVSDLSGYPLETEGLGAKLASAAGSTLVVGSDGDEWIPNGVEATFGEPFGLPFVIVPGAKHFSLTDGWGEWAGVINWVNDPASNLSVR
jgi:predicted alpha/beta hydrolase family esterase